MALYRVRSFDESGFVFGESADFYNRGVAERLAKKESRMFNCTSEMTIEDEHKRITVRVYKNGRYQGTRYLTR